MLCYADIQQLQKIAEIYECECSGNSKNDLIQAILAKVQRNETVHRLMEDLTLDDLRFLNSFLFDQRMEFSLEELMAKAMQSTFDRNDDHDWNPRTLISEYRKRGWLFNGFTPHNRFLYQFPQDFKNRFSEVLRQRFNEGLEYGTNSPAYYRDEGGLLSADIHTFLKFVADEEIPLTNQGFIYKRQLQQLLNLLSVSEEIPPKSAWRFGYGRRFKEYPERFSFLYDFCYYADWLIEDEHRLYLSEKGMKRLADRKPESQEALYRFWLRLYKGPIYSIQTIVNWIGKLAGEWVTISSLQKVLLPFIKPFYYDDAEQIFNRRIVQMMMHLGLLAIGEDESVGTVVRITELGSKIIQGIRIDDHEKITLPNAVEGTRRLLPFEQNEHDL